MPSLLVKGAIKSQQLTLGFNWQPRTTTIGMYYRMSAMTTGTARRTWIVPINPKDKLGEAPLSANPDPTAASAYQPSLDYEDSHASLNCTEDIDGHKGARIPKWMLPKIDDDLRNRLRPNILRISTLLCTTARPHRAVMNVNVF